MLKLAIDFFGPWALVLDLGLPDGIKYFATDSAAMIAAAGILAFFIFVRHRDNLKRLAAGKEPEFKLKKD